MCALGHLRAASARQLRPSGPFCWEREGRGTWREQRSPAKPSGGCSVLGSELGATWGPAGGTVTARKRHLSPGWHRHAVPCPQRLLSSSPLKVSTSKCNRQAFNCYQSISGAQQAGRRAKHGVRQSQEPGARSGRSVTVAGLAPCTGFRGRCVSCPPGAHGPSPSARVHVSPATPHARPSFVHLPRTLVTRGHQPAQGSPISGQPSGTGQAPSTLAIVTGWAGSGRGHAGGRD